MANPVLKNQIVTLSTPPATLTAGQQFTVNVGYNVSDANNKLTGIGFGIHFDSTKLQLNSITPSSAPNLFGTPSANAETINDNNATTNQEISWAYLDFAGNWPNQALPIALGTVTFTALVPFDTSTLNLPVTVAQPATGYTGPSSLAIAPATSVQNEGDVGLTPFTFTVTRSGDTSVDITAQVDVTSANSANASDFGGTFPSQTVTFLAGETSKTVTINVSGDRVVEPDEQFTVTLGDPTNATTTNTTFTNTTAIGTILDDDTATISLGVSPISVVEDGATNLVYTFTRTGGDTTTALTVNYNVGGTAALATDYVPTGATTFTASTGTVTFVPNATTATVTVNPNTDLIFEADETVALTLSTGTGYNIATAAPVTGTIANDDAAPVFAISSSSIIENGVVTFAVSRIGDAQAAQSVTVTTSIAGTDTASVNDFTTKTQTLSFAQGETTKNFTVQTTPDAVFEGNETFTATLSGATGGATISGANGIATGTINNDDAAPIFTIASASATEGNAIAFTITRSGDAQANQSVTVNTSIGGTDTANINDFTANTQILSFAQGETTKTFNVQSTQDAVFEGNETFTANLSAATSGATINAANDTATGTINNNDAAPVFAIASANGTEGDVVAFTVTRTGDAQANQFITFATSIATGDTASVTDFTTNTGTLSFAQSETSKTFSIQTIQDAIPEADETFTVSLSTPTNGAILSATNGKATGTINDDDNPRISLAIAPASVLEDGATNLVYTFTRTGLTTSALTVNYNVSGNTTFGNDYSQTGAATFNASTGTVIFAANSATATVTIDPIADIIFETDEAIALTLVNGSGYNIDTTTPVTGTITNDESVPIFAIASATATEGGTALFTITRTGDAQSTQSVTVTASIGATDNVISASDFTAKTETLSFAQGETTKTFSVQTTEDTLFESNETFTATLSTPTNGATISTTNGTATGTIDNDDPAPIFAIASTSITEGGLLKFTVTRTGDAQANQAVTVATSISGSNTTSTNDFTAKNETLTFAQGETTKTFSVQSAQDNLFEANEIFTTTLSAATNGATISSTNGLATGTINNDDPIPNATLSRDNNDVFKLDGVTTAKLKASLTDANSSFVNEVGVFNVDDASGKIGSFSMGSAGYAQAALERSEIIFSAIANKPTGYNSLNTRLLDVSESNLEFYLIKSGTTTEEALKSNNFSNVLFSQDSAQITNLGNNAFAIGWNDGSGNNDFTSLEMRVEGSDESLVIGTQQQGNSFSGNGGGEVIDLRFTSGLAADTKSVNADFVVNREAAFNNFVGFYKVTDTNGGIDINGDGVADFTPGQSGYITAAVQNRVAGIDLAVSNQGRASFTGKTFDSNSIFAPFIIVNGNTSSFTDSNTSNDPAVYFSYLGANTDGVDHIRLLGSNTFGFEDLAGGGDRDFNDIIVKATLTAVK
jgi:3-phytase